MPQIKAKSKNRWVRGGVKVLCAILLVFLCKWYVFELRYVPSPSMEPTLRQGEWIGINKLSSARSGAQRFDLALFRRDESSQVYVKRVLGLPGEKLQIDQGDLVIDGKIYRKSWPEFLRLAVTVFDSREQPLESAWVFQPNRVKDLGEGKLLFQNEVSNEAAALHRKQLYLSGPDRPGPGREPAHDAALHLRFEAPGTGAFYANLGEAGDQFLFELKFSPAQLAASISRNSKGKPELLVEKHFPPLVAGSSHELQIANLDNRLLLWLDAEELLPAIEYERNSVYTMFDAAESPYPPSPVLFGVREGSLKLEWLRLLRDLDYSSAGSVGIAAPCGLGPDEFFVLGDNTCSSEDSRSFGPIARSALFGKPVVVVYPISLIRKL